jgi:lysyl-tRNA synthetase class II
MRPMGKITFAHIEDGDGRVQLFLRANELGEEQLDLFNRDFDLGDFVGQRRDVPAACSQSPLGSNSPAGKGDHAAASG